MVALLISVANWNRTPFLDWGAVQPSDEVTQFTAGYDTWMCWAPFQGEPAVLPDSSQCALSRDVSQATSASQPAESVHVESQLRLWNDINKLPENDCWIPDIWFT